MRSDWRILRWLAVPALPIALLLFLQRDIARIERGAQCMSQFRNVSFALQAYATDNQGRLPPAYIADEHGQPMHSWRVLLLPYLDQQALYDQYRFDEPWNGPNNSKLAKFIPEVYQCPNEYGHADGSHPWTSYVAVVGPLSEKISPEVLRQLIQRDDGGPAEADLP